MPTKENAENPRASQIADGGRLIALIVAAGGTTMINQAQPIDVLSLIAALLPFTFVLAFPVAFVFSSLLTAARMEPMRTAVVRLSERVLERELPFAA